MFIYGKVGLFVFITPEGFTTMVLVITSYALWWCSHCFQNWDMKGKKEPCKQGAVDVYEAVGSNTPPPTSMESK